ncbi:pleckstrin homology domain-containing family M member 3 isoform X2 [Nerophis ophidion]|uniref:pleckstrin homology domain-containing family M member 3 isoform X2 n=1 Tax=Nerophis ophidion TaxID=159077 RepID=UPI002AE0A84D|nr:pleckstrin homology domain-containing family M member 3 isoform X2 [Nerophis ophidion]
MEDLRQLEMVGDISPALEATEDFIHCMDAIQGQGPSRAQAGVFQASRQPGKLQEVSGTALAKLSSSGVWSLLAAQQPEVGPLGLAWADNLSVLGLRHGKRSRARSTNDLATHGKDSTAASTNSAFKKGHNRSRSDVNYRPSNYTHNGLLAGDTLNNTNLQRWQQGDKGSSLVVKQAEMEHREGQRGRWSSRHVELTPCELRLYTLDSSANRQLGNAYSLSHCHSVVSPAPCGQAGLPADPRTLQAVFFNSTRVQLRAGSQWEATEWRRLMWDKVQAVRQENRVSPSSPSRSDGDSDASAGASPRQPSRPTTLALFNQRRQDVLKAGLLHQLLDQNNWRTFTFVLTTTTLQAFSTEGRGSVSHPVCQYPLTSCLGVQPHPHHADRFQAAFSDHTLPLRADTALAAQEWTEVLREVVAAQEEVGAAPALQGALLRSRERRHRDAQRAKRQSVTTSFLSLLTCVTLEKGLTAQSFRCAGCQRPVGVSRGKAKVCHYSGWYYCQSCHRDHTFLIPARLLHNWDTRKHKVSKQAKEFLEFVYEEPLLDIQQLNPALYEHCEPLRVVLRLRQRLQSLRAYLFSCRAAVAEDLRRRMFPREYLLQHIHLYSIADLQQVVDGQLAPFLSKVVKCSSAHVLDCSQCRDKGLVCELCQQQQLIFPFQESATHRCEGCGAVFHAACRQKARPCPRCVRRELHHKAASSVWSPDDCFHLPYQDS